MNSTPSSSGLSLLLLLVGLCVAGTAQAIPSFARQTGLQCAACHTSYPQLTAFGRQFKLDGYTMQTQNPGLVGRLSAMLQPSFTHTQKGQPELAATTRFNANDNIALTQASIFYGGRLLNNYNKLGGFVQVTYDGLARNTSLDLADLRWATTNTLDGKPITWGFDLNNTPTVQDLWNTTPAWGYPFSGTDLAPAPAAATLISDPLGGTVAGLGAYASWNNLLYMGVSFYKTLSPQALEAMGYSPDDANDGVLQIKGTAPYWRLALEETQGSNYYELGTFGLTGNVYPGRDHSLGTTDHYTDVGLDAMYQYTGSNSSFTGRASYIRELQTLNYSLLSGGSSNLRNHLNTLALSGSYLFDKTYGIDLAYNRISGNPDVNLYGGSPDSDYYTVQLNWLPLNKVAGPEAPWGDFDPKLSLLYTIFQKLDGNTVNVADNNTLYLQAWLTF